MDITSIINAMIQIGSTLVVFTPTKLDDIALAGLIALRNSQEFLDWLNSLWVREEIPEGAVALTDLPLNLRSELQSQGFGAEEITGFIAFVLRLMAAWKKLQPTG